MSHFRTLSELDLVLPRGQCTSANHNPCAYIFRLIWLHMCGHSIEFVSGSCVTAAPPIQESCGNGDSTIIDSSKICDFYQGTYYY